MSTPQVVVVGGGLAGCAAALACADAGVRTTLLEARARLGGATYSFQRDGLWLDNGQHVHLRCCTAYRDFIRRIGAADMVTMQARLDIPVIHPDRGLSRLRRTDLPAPLHLAASLATYRHLTLWERLSLGRAALALRRLDLEDTTLDQQTFGAWLRDRRQSDAAIEALWDLIVRPTINLPAAQASLWLAASVFQVGLLGDAAAADVGYTLTPLGRAHGEQVARALAAAGVEVRLSNAASAIQVEAGGGPSARVDATRVEAEALILAVPHLQASELLPASAHPNARRFAELGSVPIVNLHVVYDRTVMDEPFVAAIGTPVQWVFDRTASSGLAEGQCLAVSLSGAEEFAHTPTEELQARFVPELARVFPRAAQARVQAFYVTREHQATFRQAPGSHALRPGPATNLRGLYLAGAWTATGWPATMEGAVRSGLHAARAALIGLGRTQGIPEPVAA
jgi:squalene-associated FAD-dependent desaturase